MTFAGRRESRAAAEATHTGAGPLAGFESHSGRTCLGPGAAPLGRVIAGSGNNGEDGTEGARYREAYATYLHGPVLPKNPWLTDHLISRALRHRNGDMGPSGFLAPLEDHAEAEAHAAALRLACRPARRWGRPQPPAPGAGSRGRLGQTTWLGARLSQRAGGWHGFLAER
jgi:CobQ-like glutamine amidotransferase family enzyme